MGQLQDKIVLVTGGASGIGKACALAFSREGASVLLSDLDADRGHEVAASIQARGGKAHFVRADVTQPEQVESLVDLAVQTYGRLDCALNGAGILGKSFNITEWDEEDWDRVLKVNLKSVWLCMKHELRHMAGRGSGAIVNIASTAGLVASLRSAAYCAAKHAVIGLTKATAAAYGRSGIRINALCPGITDTPMMQADEALRNQSIQYLKMTVPAARMAAPEEQAEAAVWLLSDAASYVVGHSLTVDGGLVVT